MMADDKFPPKNFVKETDVAKAICEDYIHHKLLRKGHSKRIKKRFVGNCQYSKYFIKAGRVLEKLYPHVYSNVSRRISMTMTSSTLVKSSLTSVLEILFRDNVTWGKVVSMFAIASCFAEECMQQGHSEYVDDVIDCVGNFVTVHLEEWVIDEGGWETFEKMLDGQTDGRIFFFMGVFTILVGFVTTITLLVEL